MIIETITKLHVSKSYLSGQSFHYCTASLATVTDRVAAIAGKSGMLGRNRFSHFIKISFRIIHSSFTNGQMIGVSPVLYDLMNRLIRNRTNEFVLYLLF